MNQQTVSQDVLKALQAINPQEPFSPELYGAIARLFVSIACEAVALHKQNGIIQVFLTQRSATESAYRNQWHTPGSILRSGETYEDVIRRLAKREFGVPITSFQPVYEFFMQEARGWFNNHSFLVTLEREPDCGMWADVSHLPESILDHHRKTVIPKAVACFKERYNL